MEAAVNSLPDEILEIIFSYCSHSDLVQSIQNVCCRWREVAQSTRVWRNIIYSPEEYTRSEQIVDMLKISPKLQNIILQDIYDDRVLQAITDNCAELRMLKMCVLPGIDMNFIKNLQEKCPKVQYLSIPHPMLTDSDKCEDAGKFTNLKVLHLTGHTEMIFSLILKPVADYCKKLEHLELENYKFEINDLRYFLTMRKDTLHTLGVFCCDKFGECVLPALSTCELKSLSVFRYSQCGRQYEKVEYFGRLKSVRTLLISEFHSENESDDIKQIFENENMAQLVELMIENSVNFDDKVTEVIVRNCPLLKCLQLIQCYKMTDASLKMMTNLNELLSLTVSDEDNVTDTGLAHLQDVMSLKCHRMSYYEILQK